MKMITLLKDELSAVRDPRVLGRTQHLLIDILILGILAVICHAETWEEMEDFGRAREQWLRKFLELPSGIPSHDTIARVFSLIDPRELGLAFIGWVKQVREKAKAGDTICIDGKSLHGASESSWGQGRKGLHVVNAWSTTQGLVLGQLKAGGRGNAETSAAQELLDLLDVEKMILVGDAGIGKVGIVEKIVEKKADYVFPLKSNSRQFYEDTRALIGRSTREHLDLHVVEEKGHGRKEKRTIEVLRKKYFPKNFNRNEKTKEEHFKKLRAIGKITYERELPETSPFVWKEGKREIATDPIRRETEIRYFITSLEVPAAEIMEKIRLQWAIENQLHWSLDVSLGEDANKTRNKVAAENLAVARKIALNLVKQDTSRRIGIKSRLKRAGWDQEYLQNLLLHSKLAGF